VSAGRLRAGATLSPEAIFAPLADYDRIGLAVSGGPDSLALMLLAAGYAKDHPLHPKFFVYSVDHGLRPEAADEVRFVVREAGRLGLQACALRWRGRKPKTGIQEAARAARYALIADAMREDGAQILVTAHHLGDQAETVLMRLAHGSGIEGLRGMDYAADIAGLTIVRPLLGVDPADLRAVVDRAGLTPVVDPSNADHDYERVRWRAALPALAALGLDAGRINQFALRVRDADRALSAMASEAYAETTITAVRGIILDPARLAALPRAVAVRVIQHALDTVGGGKKPHALAAVEGLTGRLIQEPLTATLHGCIVSSNGITIRIDREPLKGARARRYQPTKP
jgi:tRNA(Ile)-lysidine synthase